MVLDDQRGYVAPGTQVRTDGSVRCGGADFEELAVQLLKAGHALRFRARGSSMYPLVRDGDILEVYPVRHALIDVGDVVLYRSPHSGVVVHRVVDLRTHEGNAILLLKGDSARTTDPQVQESQVLGRVVSIDRWGRRMAPVSRFWRCRAFLHLRLLALARLVYPLVRQARISLRRVSGTGV
jgi:signal peptidase